MGPYFWELPKSQTPEPMPKEEWLVLVATTIVVVRRPAGKGMWNYLKVGVPRSEPSKDCGQGPQKPAYMLNSLWFLKAPPRKM